MRNILSYTTVLLCSTLAYAQPDVRHILTIGKVTNVSVDRLGNFYFVLANSCIQKRDKDGILLQEIDFPTEHISLIEAWNPLRIFIYTKKDQRYTLLDTHLNIIENRQFTFPLNATPEQVCPGYKNNQVWVVDHIESALKKMDITSANVEATIPLPKTWVGQTDRVRFLREYQDKLFLLDKKTGIHIFNHIGIPIAQIPVVGLSNFDFIGEELCYLKAGKVILFDLYTTRERLWKNISHINDVTFVIGTDERLVIVTKDKIYFLETSP